MKSHYLDLRHTTPPAPDPAARLRARRAALAEFERVQTAKIEAAEAANQTPASPSRPSRSSRKAWMGAVATACVAVVAVSVVWLTPPEQRDVRRYAPPPTKVVTAATEPTTSVPQENTTVAVPTTTAPESESPVSPASETSILQPPPRAPEHQAPVRKPELTAQERREVTLSDAELPRLQAKVDTTDRPISRAPEKKQTPADEKDKTELGEVIVSANQQARNFEQTSPSAIVAVDPALTGGAVSGNAGAISQTAADHSLEEVAVTGARVSKLARLRGFFSRKNSASAESVSAPAPMPQANPDEGRDKFSHFTTNPVKRVADEPVSTFSVDVDTASYAFARRQINAGVLPQGDAVRVEEMINYFDYNWPVPESREEPFKPTVTVSNSPWGEGKKLVHIGIKGYELPVQQQPDVNLVLLLDVSGSMDSPDKLPLAQRSMALLLDSLKPTDTVAIVVYAGRAGEVLEPTPVRNKDTILRALNSLSPGGSTAGAEGIKLAYELAEKSFRRNGVNRILLATDGDFNVGITDQNELKSYVEREREKGVYLSVLGFGQGNYRDEMAQTLAQNGNGVAAYIDTLNEAKKVLVQESSAALFTIAKDVKLQIEFNPKTVAEYRLVGYETRALNREDFNNDKVDAGDVGAGHTVTAIYEITPIGSKSTLIDESRYAAQEKPAEDTQGQGTEYGFLKIRYKLPNGFRSKLITQPIRMDAGVPASLRDDVEFSTAVAGFAQILRGGQYTGGLSFEDVIRQAEGALGRDRHEYRAEFIKMVRRAQSARGM